MKDKIFILFFILFFMYGKSQTTYNLSVDDLFSLGVENSTKIKEFEIKRNISETKEQIAKVERLPSIGLSAANGYVGKPTIYDKDLSYLKHPYMPKWKQNYGVEINQPIYQGGRIKNSIKNASLEKEIAILDLEKNKADIKLLLIQNYLELFRLYKQRDVLLRNIEEAKKRLNNIHNLKKEGIVTNNDVLRSEIEVSNFQLSLDETEDDISIISQQLDIVLGLDEEYIIVPDTAFLSKDIHVESENYYVEQGYEKYPDLKISNYNIEKAETEKKLAKSKYLPSVLISAGNQLARPITSVSPAQDLFLNTWGVTLGVTYDISSWFDHKQTMNQWGYNIDLQNNIKKQTEQNIRINIKSAYINHEQALNRVKVLEETVIQAKDNYRITNNKYFNQLAILTDLLDAASVQLNSELQLTVAKANTIYTYYLLLNASGNL